MAMYGADVEQLNQLSSQLNAKAGDIQNVISQLSSTINSVQWQGPDANRFRSEWQTHVSQLKNVVSTLQSAAQNAKKNAQEQQSASGA